MRAELKAEAIRAGMIDLDGLKLLDMTEISLNARGEVEKATSIIEDFKRAKPWLFSGMSSSSYARHPPAHPPKQKSVKDMTDDEYRLARAALLRRRS